MSSFNMSTSESEGTDSSTDEEAAEEDLRKLEAVLEEGSLHSDYSNISSSSRFKNDAAAAEYEKIQKTLSYNKLTEEKLLRLEKILILRLRECRERLSEIHATSWNQRPLSKQQIFRYVFCGKPYFRDKRNFPPPDNEDTITMAKSGMYNYSDVACVAGWTVKDKSEFLKQILKMSQNMRKNALESKLAAIQRNLKKTDSKNAQKDIVALKKEIDSVSKLPLNEDIVLPLDKEYDWDEIAGALNYRHTAEEYRALWKLFLHPNINKKNWEKIEHVKLNQIALSNRLQDWEKIANELNTGRTGYQCFVYYRTNMGNSVTGQKWTKEEEEYLRRLIDYYKDNNYIPWGKVASSMENRTKIQIYNKYARLLELRKGRFLPEEDTVLLTGVENFGTNFKKLAKYLPGRSSAQLRTRYHVLSNSNRTSVVWTVEEDKKLIQLMANQDSMYINYAAITQYFPDKDRVQLRARYVTLVKWMKKHPNKDIFRAPRRGARRLGHGQGQGDLNKAVENLKKRIKCEIETKKSKKVTKDSPEDVIEHAIITALINENIREEELKKQLPQTDMSDTDEPFTTSNANTNEINLRKLLILLKVKLNKEKFENSTYALQYPRLKQPEAESYSIKVKSYSKKAATNLIKVEDHIKPPDIWGNNRLTTNIYALPPNYSIITGCRRLMAFASAKSHQVSRSNILNQFAKKNVLVREQINIFMERFNTLFLWPILLSNEPPKEKNTSSVQIHVEKHVKRRERLLAPISVIIPNKVMNIVNDTIDLPSQKKSHDSDTVVNPRIGYSDFMLIDDEDVVHD